VFQSANNRKEREKEKLVSWRKLQNEEPHNFYFSQNLVKIMNSGMFEMNGVCSSHGTKEMLIQL
jgi:hypothetical protein